MVPGVELAKYSSVYVKDMSSGEVKLVNTSDTGQPSNDNGYGTQLSISADGNLVAFTSGASNLTNDQTNGNASVYVKNLKTGEVILASSSNEGVPADSYSGITSDSLSANGEFIAFESQSGNLVPQGEKNEFGSYPSNGKAKIFIKNLISGEIVDATLGSGNEAFDDHAYLAGISGDGTKVSFTSYSANMDPHGDNGSDVFLVEAPLCFRKQG